jgi:pyruvate dehydrogenase E2 component (dihydrolipoamide acetyltransferase)
MATDVIMPALGVAQEKGTLLNWRKAEGQRVAKGEPLMEIETDKATVEIEAPASGILTNVTASAGDEIPVGNKIAVILAPGEAAPPATVQNPHPAPLPEGEGRSEARPLARGEGSAEGRPATSTATPPTEATSQIWPHVGERILASPAARRIARERGVDIAPLKGSGPGGSVLAEDVLRATTSQPTAAGTAPKIKETVQLTPMRRIIAERMANSKQTAPHFYLTMHVDMTEVDRQRTASKENREPLIPSINDYILSACARALPDFPLLNASFTDQGVSMYSDINLGVAVALQEGLVVPVIRNADRLSLREIAQQSRELAEKAQKKKLFPSDYEGGTFTVSNLGMLGVDNFVAIINPPQCAILAVGQVAPRVVSDDQGFAARPMMTMSLSADHRVVDGAVAARFLKQVKELLERELP